MILVAACTGGEPDTTIDVVFDPCAPIAIEAIGASADGLAGIDAALALWRGHGLLAAATRDARDGALLYVAFETAAPQLHGVTRSGCGTSRATSAGR
jgi:hypothetical protein